ncbi:two-component response regulator-like APRR5 [Magnolia sinica]|uniref:two-component response regulator-like APRR5 n=1 Tax=Magnolia sinica TaxID=86752 RepID=UPI00265857C0|nr:two-component response regulator-like APRR5 [Magnolia sinica]
MYDYSTPDLLLGHPLDLVATPTITILPPPPPDQFTTNAFDSIREALMTLKSDASGYNNYMSPSSLPSYLQRPAAIQRSVSSHALRKDVFHPPFSSCDESMRRVFSTGDLQLVNNFQHNRRSESPLGHENCSHESVTKVGRYSPEERRERIERYRSKRNQRNFHKKIKYACRKTLADSRPRVRGRFARNEETGESSQSQWGQPSGDDDEEDDEAWINFLDAFSTNLIP